MLNWRWKLFETAFTVIKYSLFGSESQSCLATLPLVIPTPCSYLTMYILFISIIIRHIYIYIMYIVTSTYGYLLLKLLLLSMLMQIMVSCVNSLDFIARWSPALPSPFHFCAWSVFSTWTTQLCWMSQQLSAVSVCLSVCLLMVQWRRGHDYVTCLYRQEVVWWRSKLIMHTAGGLLSCLAGVPPTKVCFCRTWVGRGDIKFAFLPNRKLHYDCNLAWLDTVTLWSGVLNFSHGQ